MSTSDKFDGNHVLTDRQLSLRQFSIAFSWGIGLGLISISATFFATVGSMEENPDGREFVRKTLNDFSNRYLYSGIALLVVGPFMPRVLNLLNRWQQRRRYFSKRTAEVLTYAPKYDDHFVIVIEGVGSHGLSDKPQSADVIANKAVEELISSRALVTSARFYASSGVRDLLK